MGENSIEAEYQDNLDQNLRARVENLAIGSKSYISTISQKIKDRPLRIPTGIKELDEVLGGGWSSGINIVTAAPSIGKTTILIQSAAAMAARGVTVVYLTQDMREIDLVGKIISHLSYKVYGEDCYSLKNILGENVLDDNSLKSKTVIEELEKTQKYLHIRDLISDPDFNSITMKMLELEDKDKLTKIFHIYTSIYKNVILIIDSLQQLAAYGGNGSGKEAVDKQLKQFKYLTTTYQVPIILISTMNRNAYTKDNDITFSALKESGNIEYDIDLILALQPHLKIDSETTITMDDFKRTTYRDTLIKCIKSRDGNGDDIIMSLYARGCTFVHSDTEIVSGVNTTPKGNKAKPKAPDSRVPANQGYC